MPDIYPYGRDAPEGTYFAERRGGFDRGGGGPGEEWDPGSANNSATASAAAELARMWATAPFGVEPDATNYPGFFSSLHYATIVQNFLDASADTQVLFNDGGDIVGNADLTFNKISGVLRMPGGVEQLTDATTWLAYRKTSTGAPIGGLYGSATGLAFHTYNSASPSLPTSTFGGSASGLTYITYTADFVLNRAGGSTVLTADQDGKFLFTPYVPNQVTVELYEGQLKLYTPYSNYIAPLNIPHGSVPAVLSNGDIWTTTSGVFARVNGVTVELSGGGGGGVTDHGALTGLSDNDHPQYALAAALGSAAYVNTSTFAANAHEHSASDITGGVLDSARIPDITAAKVDSGAAPDGHVLTADGAGNAAWEAVSGGGGGTWGSITGTLSAQTDLQSALDAKAASSHTHVEQDVAGARYHEAATAPGTISVGDEWFDTSSGILYKRIDNDGSPTWAEMNTDGPPSPSGISTSVQYNDGGAMAGDANLTWDKTGRLFRAYGNFTMNTAAPPALSSIIHGSSGNWQFIGNSLVGSTGDNLRIYSNCYANASHAYIAPGTSSGGILSFAGQAWEFYAFPSGLAGRTVTPVLGLRVADDGVIVDSGRIRFPVTQIPSTDVNTLDDYEENTWTPTVTASAGSITSYSATGKYTKIGNVVHCVIGVTITNVGTGTGSMIVTLPFTNSAAVSCGAGRENAVGGYMLQIYVGASSSSATVFKYDNTGPMATGATMYMQLTYLV